LVKVGQGILTPPNKTFIIRESSDNKGCLKCNQQPHLALSFMDYGFNSGNSYFLLRRAGTVCL